MACTRCGSNANQCACLVQGRRGVDVSGTGAPNDPYTLEFDGGGIVGNGLAWNSDTRRLSVRLADNTLAFSPSGGLYVTGKEGDAGSGEVGATAEDLENRADNQDVVAGLHGAGYMIKPENMRASITYGVQRGIDAMHLPVRFLHDGTPVVAADETLDSEQLGSWGGHVQDQDMQRWRTIPTGAGLWPETEAAPLPSRDFPGRPGVSWGADDRPQWGWFGYLEPSQLGLTSLADVFDLVGRSCVLILELRFPPIKDGLWDGKAPPDNRVAAFVERTSTLIRRYGLARSVVVVTETPKVPHGDGTMDVLEPFRNVNTRVGPVLRSQTQADTYPPDAASWPTGWSWVVLGSGLAMDTITGYTGSQDPKLHCLLNPVSRQHQHADLVQPSGAMGVLSPDPEYFAGVLSTHPTGSNYSYRRNRTNFEYGTVMHGTLPPKETRDNARGANRIQMRRIWNESDQVPTDGECFISHTTPTGRHFLLLGQNCPIEDPENYLVDFWVDVRQLGSNLSDGPTRAELAFGVPKDVPLGELADAPNNAGYILWYGIQGRNGDKPNIMRVQLWGHNGTQEVAGPSINLDSTAYRMRHLRLYVNPQGIYVHVLNANNPDQIYDQMKWEPSSDNEELPTRHRGPYLYLGRHSTAGSSFQLPAFKDIQVHPGQGSNVPNEPAMFSD